MSAFIERKIQHEEGTVIVRMELRNNGFASHEVIYDVSVSLIPPRKRKPIWCTNSCSFGDDVFGWDWRKASLEERQQIKVEFVKKYVDSKTMLDIRNELLDNLKNQVPLLRY